MKLIQALKNKRGNGVPLAVAITLALVIIFAGISEYLRLLLIAQGVRDAVQSSVISVVNDNYDDVYHGVREGYSGAYQPMGGSFEASLDYGDIYGRLNKVLGLTRNGTTHSKLNPDGSVEYTLTGLSVSIRNAPLAGGNSAGNRFLVTCTIDLEVPVRFGGMLLPPMRIKLKTSAGWTPIF